MGVTNDLSRLPMSFTPELSQYAFREVMLTHELGREWVENWE